MLTFLKKNLRLVLIVAAVLVLGGGFLLLNKGNHDLRVWDTAVKLEEIRSIRQLVSATYTGETGCDYFTAYKSVMDSLCRLEPRQQEAYFRAHPNQPLLRDEYFDRYRAVFALEEELRKADVEEQAAPERGKKLAAFRQKTLERLNNTKEKLYKAIVNPKQNYFTLSSGTVRAGINLANARIDEEKQQIILPPVQLLDTVITGRKGFIGSGNQLTEREAFVIRCNCADRLADEAIQNGQILTVARKNAIETVQQFLKGVGKSHYTVVVEEGGKM